jgi:hypothetical protein
MSSRACFLPILSRDHIHDSLAAASFVDDPVPYHSAQWCETLTWTHSMNGTQKETTDSCSRYSNIGPGSIQS